MSADNIEIVRRWFDEVWNQRRTETIEELLAEESICYGDGTSMRGPAEFRDRQFMPLVTAFPDLQATIDGIIAQGDEVAVRWSGTGHHTGDGLGFAPTGEKVSFQGMSWIVARDGKLHEGWQRSNIRDVLTELAMRAQGHQSPPSPLLAVAPF